MKNENRRYRSCGKPWRGSRVARALLLALKRVRPDTSITFFGNPHSIKREKQDDIFKAHGIPIHALLRHN